MSAFLTMGHVLQCKHQGSVKLKTSNGRTSTGGPAILRLADLPFEVDCPVLDASKKCKLAQGFGAATKSLITGSPPLTEAGVVQAMTDSTPPVTVSVLSGQEPAGGA